MGIWIRQGGGYILCLSHRTKNRYIHCSASILSPVLRLLRRFIDLPISLLPLSLLSRISTAVIFCCPSPPLTLSGIPIIPHLYRASIVILPRLCFFLISLSFIVPRTYLPSFFWILGSDILLALHCSEIQYSLHSAPIFFSIYALIFSPLFYLISWHGSYLSL